MTIFRTIIKEPLLHFLLLGTAVYAVAFVAAPDEADQEDPNVIVVDRDTILTWLQYRSKTFEAGLFDATIDTLTAEQRTQLIDDYLEQEILYREALAWGLDDADFIIRQRLIQKQQYLIDTLTPEDPGDEALTAYMEVNAGRYYTPPFVTFSHLFFSDSKRGGDAAWRAALQASESLTTSGNADSAVDIDADRFPYFANYVERTFDYVSGHFGEETASQIFELAPDASTWVGPLRSPYGVHLIQLRHREGAGSVALDKVRDLVLADWQTEKRHEQNAAVLAGLKKKYTIRIELEGED